MKNFITRALVGILFVGILMGAIYYDRFSFAAIFALITGLTVWEMSSLLKHYEQARIQQAMVTIGGVYLFIASFIYTQELTDSRIFIPYLLFLLLSFTGELYYKAPNPILNWSLMLLVQLYGAGSFAILNLLSRPIENVTNAETNYHWLFILALFVFIWLNDTGAYLVGSLFGRHRLFERISPKKSWEGFWGGLVLAIASSLVFAHFVPAISQLHWIGLALTIVLFGTWGDLVESLLKRTLGIKDSGHILPGHGGMLDRFDSVMMAAPAGYIYVELFIRN